MSGGTEWNWLTEREKDLIEKSLGCVWAKEAGRRVQNFEGDVLEEYRKVYQHLTNLGLEFFTNLKRKAFFSRVAQQLGKAEGRGSKEARAWASKLQSGLEGEEEEKQFFAYLIRLSDQRPEVLYPEITIQDHDLEACIRSVLSGGNPVWIKKLVETSLSLGLIPHHRVEPEKPLFSVGELEFSTLHKDFGLLCHDAAWKVVRSYRHEDQESIVQELFIALLRSASQYKKKTFFAKAFKYLKKLGLHSSPIVASWKKSFEEHRMAPEVESDFFAFLDHLPPHPDKPKVEGISSLDIGGQRYIKTCIWNQQKAALKELAKERNQRRGEISLSEKDSLVDIEEQGVESNNNSSPSLREEIFEKIRNTLAEKDKRAARTYGILTDPKNQGEVFPQTSRFKLKINSVRKRTQQSYRSIKSDLRVIENVIKEEIQLSRGRVWDGS